MLHPREHGKTDAKFISQLTSIIFAVRVQPLVRCRFCKLLHLCHIALSWSQIVGTPLLDPLLRTPFTTTPLQSCRQTRSLYRWPSTVFFERKTILILDQYPRFPSYLIIVKVVATAVPREVTRGLTLFKFFYPIFK